jgi:glucosylceramidase
MNFERIPAAIAAVSLSLSLAAYAQSIPDAHVWLSTPDHSSAFAEQPQALHFSAAAGDAPAIAVNDMQEFQPIEGFGFAVTGGSAELLMKMSAAKRSELLNLIFSPEGDGIGASYIRLSIGSSDMNDHVYSYDDMPAGQTDPTLAKFSLAPDEAEVIPVVKEILAIDPQIKILGSPWSAPAWMKTNDDVRDGHLKPEFYGAYAQYLTKYVEGMKAEGIPIAAITVENEPLNPKNTPSMVVFADEENAFIGKSLGPAFEAAGVKTEIHVYDHNPDVRSYPETILGDPVAGKYVAGTAFHLYGGAASLFTATHDAYPNKNIYMTEQSVTQRPGAKDLDIAEPVERVMIGATRNWSRNALLWNLAADPHAGPHTNNGGCGGCYGAITLDGDKATFNVAYYVAAHFSKFVRPGSVRIGSSEMEQLSTAAFLTPAGKIVLVVDNTGNFPKTFRIVYHGQSATAALPSESVATYVW